MPSVRAITLAPRWLSGRSSIATRSSSCSRRATRSASACSSAESIGAGAGTSAGHGFSALSCFRAIRARSSVEKKSAGGRFSLDTVLRTMILFSEQISTQISSRPIDRPRTPLTNERTRMVPNSLRVAASGLAVSILAAGAQAQWSSNPASNLKLADGTNEQVQPKMSPTADGGCYVAWYDNGSVNYKSDTWTWSGSAWTLQNATGPSARFRHSLAFDSSRGKTVLFGGTNAAGSVLGDTWEWDGTGWAQNNIAGPSARDRFAMAYDAASSQI